MDDELGAVAASERSEHAASVTSLAVHWIGPLGSTYDLSRSYVCPVINDGMRNVTPVMLLVY